MSCSVPIRSTQIAGSPSQEQTPAHSGTGLGMLARWVNQSIYTSTINHPSTLVESGANSPSDSTASLQVAPVGAFGSGAHPQRWLGKLSKQAGAVRRVVWSKKNVTPTCSPNLPREHQQTNESCIERVSRFLRC